MSQICFNIIIFKFLCVSHGLIKWWVAIPSRTCVIESFYHKSCNIHAYATPCRMIDVVYFMQIECLCNLNVFYKISLPISDYLMFV